MRDVLPRQIHDEARLDRLADPEPGVAVGLQLDANLAALRPGVAIGAAQDARQVLDVVAVLVGEDVRLGERPASAPSCDCSWSKKPRSM